MPLSQSWYSQSVRTSLFLLICLMVAPSVAAPPPWLIQYRAEVKAQRALLKARQLECPVPPPIHAQQKKALRLYEKDLRRWYQANNAPGNRFVPIGTAVAQPSNSTVVTTRTATPNGYVIRSYTSSLPISQPRIVNSQVVQPQVMQPRVVASPMAQQPTMAAPARSAPPSAGTAQPATYTTPASNVQRAPTPARAKVNEPTLAPIPATGIPPAALPGRQPAIEKTPAIEPIPIPAPSN